jgi:hypothetical protein
MTCTKKKRALAKKVRWVSEGEGEDNEREEGEGRECGEGDKALVIEGDGGQRPGSVSLGCDATFLRADIRITFDDEIMKCHFP